MKKYIPYIIIVVLLAALIFSLIKRKEVTVEKLTSDTVTVVKFDTIYDILPIVMKEKVVDTIFIDTKGDSVIELPISQKYYETEEYHAWVSGYKPSLDSIYTFGKVITRTITNTDTKYLDNRKTDVYLDLGCNYIGERFAPFLGANITFKKGISIGGNIGYYDKNAYYGLKIGYKINK